MRWPRPVALLRASATSRAAPAAAGRRGGLGRLVPAPMTYGSKVDAGRFLASVQADQARGTFIDPRGGRISFACWAEQWVARTNKRPNSVVRDRQALSVFMAELGPRPLATITPMHVQETVDARAKIAAPATVARDFSALRAVFNAAVHADLIGRSPCRKVALPRVRPPARPVLGPLELQRLASVVPARYGALLLVAGVLGLRWGEAVALRAETSTSFDARSRFPRPSRRSAGTFDS